MHRDALRDALRLYLVADLAVRPDDLPAVVEACIAAGVTCVQLRAKDAEPDRVVDVARELRRVCSASQSPFIVNDDLDLALAVGADGVHLGVGDTAPEVAREAGGAGFIIGFSPETDEQIRQATGRGVSYLGVGPLFGTATKIDAGAALGHRELARRLSLTELPSVAIGGIDATNAAVAIAAGADGVAVISSILKSGYPARASRELRSVIDAARLSATTRH